MSISRVGARERRIGMLAFDGVMLLDLSGPADVFMAANRQVPNAYSLDVLTASGHEFTTSVGASMRAVSARDSGEYDTVLVVGSAVPAAQFVRPELADAAWRLAGRTRRFGSVCTGAFVLGEAGLLDGLRATTHWKFTRDLAHRYPLAAVEHDAVFVRDGSTYTSAGACAGIDLALALVEEDLGSAVAHAVARDLLVYLQRGGGQSQFSPAATPRPSSQVLRGLTDHIRANPEMAHSARSMAAHVHISERQLARWFREELDTTPAAFVASLRFHIACDRLRAGASVSEASAAAGFASSEIMRRSFVARLGVSPRDYGKQSRRGRETSASDARVAVLS